MRLHVSELDEIEAGLLALHRSSFQHRAWEDLQKRSGVMLDKASAALLKTVASGSDTCRMHEIAASLGIEAPSVTRKVQELEQDNLLKRRPDPEDKRAAIITITAKGKSRLEKLQQARRETLASALKDWSAHDRRTFASLLKRLADDLSTPKQT